MRKIYVITFTMLMVGFTGIQLYSQNSFTFYPKISYDLPGKHTYTIAGEGVTSNTAAGFSVGMEVLSKSYHNFNFGGGISRLFPRRVTADNYQTFFFIPIYGIVAYNYFDYLGVKFSAVGNIGYNGIYSGSDNYITGSAVDNFSMAGSLYYAGGLRFDKDIYFLDVFYKYYSGKVPNYSITANYTTVSVSFGFAL